MTDEIFEDELPAHIAQDAARPPGEGPFTERVDLTPEMLKGLRYEAIGDTLAITSPQCTCDGGVYGHEQYCGTDPVVIGLTQDLPERMEQLVEEMNWLLDQLRKALTKEE